MNTIKLQKTNTCSIYCYKKKKQSMFKTLEKVQVRHRLAWTANGCISIELVVIIGRFSAAAAAEDEEVGVYGSRQASALTSARRVL
jgi:hypothetical protein